MALAIANLLQFYVACRSSARITARELGLLVRAGISCLAYSYCAARTG